jgi:ubiquinone/menaquinone biosynthesis C-methylase UbiE
MASVVHWVEGEHCCSDRWEAAYRRFETPEQEVRKFRRRLAAAGAGHWPKDSAVVELFCGRGSGLYALASLGFTRLSGVDLSPSLLAQYSGPATCFVGDCRQLQFDDQSLDIVVVQGGLHHLPNLSDDLERVMSEARRVLRPSGRLFVVEPWLTPFLRAVHAASRRQSARRLWSKLDALATMIEHEERTYQAWLSRPEFNLRVMRAHFFEETCKRTLGKLVFIGRPRSVPLTNGGGS